MELIPGVPIELAIVTPQRFKNAFIETWQAASVG
jgi:hypothetical protein